jgi:hypothetical protein
MPNILNKITKLFKKEETIESLKAELRALDQEYLELYNQSGKKDQPKLTDVEIQKYAKKKVEILEKINKLSNTEN